MLVGADNRSQHVVTTDLADGRNWKSEYVIQTGDSGLVEWSIQGIDRIGHALQKSSSENSISGLSFQSYDNGSDNYTFSADTREPLVDNLSLSASRNDLFSYGNNNKHVIKVGDNLTLSFTTDESIDNDSLSVSLKIGSDNRSSMLVKSIENDNNTSWKASYSVVAQDKGLVEWEITGVDRAGNALTKNNSLGVVSSLNFQSYLNKTYDVDNDDPDVITINITNTNQGKRLDNDSILLAKAGDNITFEFTLNEPIHHANLNLRFDGLNPSGNLQSLFYDNQSDTNQSGQGKYWKTVYTIDENDNGTISFILRGSDPAGNQISLDNQTVAKISDYNPGPDNLSLSFFDNKTIEVDNTRPEIRTIGITNSNQATKLNNQNISLAKPGDNISVEFSVSEPIGQPGLNLTLEVKRHQVSY